MSEPYVHTYGSSACSEFLFQIELSNIPPDVFTVHRALKFIEILALFEKLYEVFVRVSSI